MLATGGLMTAIALLTLAAVAPVFRSENPPRWTTRGWIGEVVTLAIVCTLALGLGYLGAGAIEAFETGADLLDIALLGMVLLVSVLIVRRLSARNRTGVVARAVSSYAPGPEAGQAGSHGRMGAEPVLAAGGEHPHKAA
jgi:hypothetical protein